MDPATARRARKTMGSVRMILVLATIVFIAGEGAYIAGFGAIRYKDINHDPFFTWGYWRYLINGFVGPVLLVALWYSALKASTSSGNQHSSVLFYGCGAAIAWFIVWIVFESIEWSNCNTIVLGVKIHPHCVNREFPSITTPDPAFFLTFFGTITLGAFSVIALILADKIRCADNSRQASSLLPQAGGDYDDGGDEEQPLGLGAAYYAKPLYNGPPLFSTPHTSLTIGALYPLQ